MPCKIRQNVHGVGYFLKDFLFGAFSCFQSNCYLRAFKEKYRKKFYNKYSEEQAGTLCLRFFSNNTFPTQRTNRKWKFSFNVLVWRKVPHRDTHSLSLPSNTHRQTVFPVLTSVDSAFLLSLLVLTFPYYTSVPESGSAWHMGTNPDPDPWIRTLDLRILLFSSVTSMQVAKEKCFFLLCFAYSFLKIQLN